MTVKVQMANGGSDSVDFVNAAGTTLAQVKGYDDTSNNGHLEFYTDTSGTLSEKVRVQNGLHIQQDSSSNNRLVFRGQPSSSYRWNIDNYGSSNQMRFFREDDSNAANGAVMMTIDNSGNLLVGTTSSVAGKLQVKNSSGDASTGIVVIESGTNNYWSQYMYTVTHDFYLSYNNSNRGYFSSSTGVYVATSDQRLKKNISDIEYGLSSVLALRPTSYHMTEQEDSDKKNLGFIAQEALEVVPESVFEMQGGMYGMDKSAIIPVLVKAIQEQQAIINAQDAVLKQLTERITALENK